MLLTKVTLGAAGVSAWVPINYLQAAFGVGLGVVPSSGSTLNYTVQHTFDKLDQKRVINISRSGTTATVSDTAHGLSVGDSVIIRGSGDSNLEGTQIVASIVDANNYTYTVSNTGLTASVPGCTGTNLRVFPHASLAAQTARLDGNYNHNITACRLKLNTWAAGTCDLLIAQGMGS